MAEDAARRRTQRWPASVALLACALFYVVLTNRLVVGPRWLLPVLIVLPIVPLEWHHYRKVNPSPWARCLALGLLALISAANIGSMGLLVHRLLVAHVSQGRALVYSAVVVWLTNITVSGLWFWEVDRGGPTVRGSAKEPLPDLQFPQMENPNLAPKSWLPQFSDYLYSAFANGTSFAPADAMPLSGRMKLLFTVEAVVSLVTIAIVAARAVNILN